MPLILKKPIFLRFCNKDRKDSHALTITELASKESRLEQQITYQAFVATNSLLLGFASTR